MIGQPQITGQAQGPSTEPDRWLVQVPRRSDEPLPLCAFYSAPTAEQVAELGLADGTETVFGCESPQGDGPLWFYVPVAGGAVRVGVCTHHADLLTTSERRPLNPFG